MLSHVKFILAADYYMNCYDSANDIREDTVAVINSVAVTSSYTCAGVERTGQYNDKKMYVIRLCMLHNIKSFALVYHLCVTKYKYWHSKIT